MVRESRLIGLPVQTFGVCQKAVEIKDDSGNHIGREFNDKSQRAQKRTIRNTISIPERRAVSAVCCDFLAC